MIKLKTKIITMKKTKFHERIKAFRIFILSVFSDFRVFLF